MRKIFLEKAGAAVCAVVLACGMSAGSAFATPVTDTSTSTVTASTNEFTYEGSSASSDWTLFVDVPAKFWAGDCDGTTVTIATDSCNTGRVLAGATYSGTGSFSPSQDEDGTYRSLFSKATTISISSAQDSVDGALKISSGGWGNDEKDTFSHLDDGYSWTSSDTTYQVYAKADYEANWALESSKTFTAGTHMVTLTFTIDWGSIA